MLKASIVARRKLRRALLLGTTSLLAGPAYAACETSGTAGVVQCDIEGVDIELSGSAGSVTLDDFTLDPADHVGYARIYANDDVFAPTAVTVTLSGDTTITTYNYLGMDVRTKVGDINVDVGADVAITAQQTGIYIESGFDSGGLDYDGGEVVLTNRGTIVAGPDNDPMGAEGIWAVSNGGGVAVYNYGSVRTTTTVLGQTVGRGIVADGGNMATDEVEVSIYNDGIVESQHDGLRVNSYNGLGSIVNDVNGVVTSHDRRGVVVWSAANSAAFENRGAVTALDATAVNVWAEGTISGDAGVVNSGTIAAYDTAGSNVTDSLFNGVHVWSEVFGAARLTNRAGGSITAEDGWAAWMQSTVGDVAIDNAGLLKGKSTAVYVGADQLNELAGTSLADYEGAMHGDLTLNNSGLVTAFETAAPLGDFGLVTLAGADIGTLSVTNLAGGIIGAGHDFSAGFDVGQLDAASATGLDALLGAAANSAVVVGAEAGEISIDNRGTLFGNVRIMTPEQLYGIGPDETGTVVVRNSGLWVTSGVSELTADADSASFRNAGSIWTLGTTALNGDFVNEDGVVTVAATGTAAAGLVLGGDFTATGASRLAFDLGAGAPLGPDSIVEIAGDVSGQTELVLADLSGWDWKAGTPLDLVTVDGLAALGSDSFALADLVHGLVHYELDYDDGSQTWSIGEAAVSEQSLDELDTIADATQASLSAFSGDILNRTDDIRDQFWSEAPVAPLGYAEAAASPAEAAIAAITPAPSTIRTWTRSRGAWGDGDGFAERQGLLELGADVAATLDGSLVAVGAFGGLSHTHVDFDGSDSLADLSGTGIGVYGTVMGAGGLYASGTVLAERVNIDLSLSGEAASLDALSVGARFDAGYRLQLADFSVEPGVGLRVDSTSFGGFTMSNTDVAIADGQGLAAEARLRLARTLPFGTLDVTPFAVFTLGSQTGDNRSIALSDLDTAEVAGADGWYGGLAGGLAVSSEDGMLTGYLRGDLTASEEASWAAIRLGGAYRF